MLTLPVTFHLRIYIFAKISQKISDFFRLLCSRSIPRMHQAGFSGCIWLTGESSFLSWQTDPLLSVFGTRKSPWSLEWHLNYYVWTGSFRQTVIWFFFFFWKKGSSSRGFLAEHVKRSFEKCPQSSSSSLLFQDERLADRRGRSLYFCQDSAPSSWLITCW